MNLSKKILQQKPLKLIASLSLLFFWICRAIISCQQPNPTQIILTFNVFDNLLWMPLHFLYYLSGLFTFMIIPGWLICASSKRIQSQAEKISYAFLISLGILVASTTLFKAISGPLTQLNFTLMITAIILAEILLLKENSDNFFKTSFSPIKKEKWLSPIFILFILICVLFIYNDRILDLTTFNISFNKNFILSIPLGEQTDLLERFGLANSLYTHILPYWDLEYANQFGYVFIDPPLCAFIQSFLFLLNGETYAALILFSLLLLTVLFIILISNNSKNLWSKTSISGYVLISFLFFFRNHFDEFIYTIPIFSFFLIISFIYLSAKKYQLFLFYGIAATLTKFYGIFFIFIALIGFSIFFSTNEERRACKKITLQYFLFLLGFFFAITLIGLFNQQIQTYFASLLIEHFSRLDFLHVLDKFYPQLSDTFPALSLTQRIEFLIRGFKATGFIMICLFFLPKTQHEKLYFFIFWSYFILLIISRYQMDRYLIPLIPLTVIYMNLKIDYFWHSKRKALE